MASLKVVDIEDDEEHNNSISHGNNSALQKRRNLRKRSSITTCTNSSSDTITTTTAGTSSSATLESSTTSVLERRNSVPYFANPQCRPSAVGRRQRSLSSCCTLPTGHNAFVRSDQFMAQHVTITRAIKSTTKNSPIVHPSKENLCDTLRQQNSSLKSQPSVDIDIHVVYGSSNVINHINLNKQKLMAPRKPLPTIRGRKSAIALEDTPHKVESNKMELAGQGISNLTGESSTRTLSKKANRSAKLLKAKEAKANRGNILKSKPNEVPKRGQRTVRSVIKRKSVQNKTSRFTQTDNEVMQPCASFMANKKCPIQLICPYLHSEFPCKYYYLDLVCPNDNNCQFMHNGLLSEKMKDALRNHILKQLSHPATLSEPDLNFLQQTRDKQDLWACLQNFQNKLRTESGNAACQSQQRKISLDANEQIYFQYSPKQLEFSDPEMQQQLNFLTPQQLEFLYYNYKIKSRDDLMHLSLGQLHEIGIIQSHEVAAIMHVALSSNNKVAEQQQQHGDVKPTNEISEIIEVDDDDDDDYGSRLVIDECCNEPNANLPSVSNEVSHSEMANSQLDELEERYKNIKEIHNVIDSVEDSLQNLKDKTIPNNVRAVELMALYEKLTLQEKLIKQNSISRAQVTTSTPENNANNDNILSSLPATLCEVVVDDTCINDDLVIAEDEGQTSTEVENLLPNISEEILAPNDHLSFNSDDIGTVEIPHSDAIETLTIEEIPHIVTDEIDATLEEEEDVLEIKENETSTDSSVIMAATSSTHIMYSPEAENTQSLQNEDILTPSHDNDVVNEIHIHELPMHLEISSEEKQIIDQLSVTKLHGDTNEDEDSPPYEDITSSGENTPKSRPKCLTKSSTSRNVRPRLRSDSLQQNENISTSNSPDVLTKTIKINKIFKPRRLKIPKPRELKMETSSKELEIDKDNDKKASQSMSQTRLEEASAQKVILSNRYAKKAKTKCQNLELLEDCEGQNTVKSESHKTDNYMTDESVESLMSALYGHDDDDDANIDNCDNNIKSKESNTLTASQDPLIAEDDAMETQNQNIPVAQKARNKLSRNKVISLKIAATHPKTKRLKSRNITITKSTVRRRVSFETPSTSSNTSSSLSSEGIVSKCDRGKPYVLLTKLKPQLLKTLQKQMENDSSTASYTSITTTCNITNSSSSTTTASFGSPSCLCDGTSPVLGKKRSCLVNNDDEENDYECDLKVHRKLLRMDSMDILNKNNMECEAETTANTMTQRITYHNNVVFEDISTTDYYSSSDEKPSETNTLQLASSIAKPPISAREKTQQKQLQKKSDLRQQIANVDNKSDLKLLHSQQQLQENNTNVKSCCNAVATSKRTTEDTSDLQEPLLKHENTKNEKSCPIAHVDIEDDQYEHEENHHSLLKVIDENQNEKTVVAHPPTPPKSSNKLSYVLLRSSDEVVGTEKAANVAKNEIHLSSAAKGVVVKYDADVVNNERSNARIKDENVEITSKITLYNKLSAPHTVKRQINFENTCVNITPIASPTHVCDDIASPSPVRGGGGGILVAAFEYQLGGEIDGRLTIPNTPYFLREIDLSGLEINKPNNIDRLMKTSSLDPRIFRSQTKSITTYQSQQTSTHYQTSANQTPIISASPYDPRNRSHHMTAQQAPQQHVQNALMCYTMNPTSGAVLPSTSPVPEVMQNFMSTQMNMMAVPSTPAAFAPSPQQKTPNMILYECIQSSTWYHGLSSSSKMQVNQSTTHLVTALNNFQRERRLNPAATFDIFKLDSAIELLDNMTNLGICVDTNGVIHKQPQVTGYAGRPCQAVGAIPSCNATYSFIQQVLAPTAQCAAMPRVAGMCHEPFVSCYLEPPKPAGTIPCCAHKHQQEDITQPAEQPPPPPSSDENYNDNRRYNNNNQFRKPFNQNQSQRPYNNQRFNNNNPRFSKPSSSYSYGGGGGGIGDSNSPTRSSSPQSQSFSPRGGGGRYNKRPYNNSGDGGSWSSSPPSASSKPFNNNRKFNRNNNFNKNSNYGNNKFSPTRSTSPNQSAPSRNGIYEKLSSSPPQHQKTPPPLSPRPDGQQSPILNSPAKQQQKYQPTTDEECWD